MFPYILVMSLENNILLDFVLVLYHCFLLILLTHAFVLFVFWPLGSYLTSCQLYNRLIHVVYLCFSCTPQPQSSTYSWKWFFKSHMPLWGGCFVSTITYSLRLRISRVGFQASHVCSYISEPHNCIACLHHSEPWAKPCRVGCCLDMILVLTYLPEIFLCCLYNRLLSLISTVYLNVSKLFNY